MTLRTIRAEFVLNTPDGVLRKNVNWSSYESKTTLTLSTTSSEAFNRFLINYKRFIKHCKRDLQYLDSIFFYEDQRTARGKHKKMNLTKTIKVEEGRLKVLCEQGNDIWLT